MFRAVTERLPNVSGVGVSNVLESIKRLLGDISTGARAAGLVTLLASALVVGGAIGSAFYIVLFAAMMFWFARKDLPGYVSFAARHLVGSLLCLGGAIWFLSQAEQKVLMAPVAAAIYLVGAYVLGIWRWHHVMWAVERAKEFRDKQLRSKS